MVRPPLLRCLADLFPGTNHAQSVLLLEQLKERLVSAQLERANKIEYDIIAKKINKLPSREQGVMYVPSRHPA